MVMFPLAGSNAHQPPLSASEPEVSEVAMATAFNSSVQVTDSCSGQLPDSGERPEHSLDEQQITALKPGIVKTELGKSPTRFQENDLLLVYPCSSSNGRTPGLDLKINPEKLKNRLDNHITEFLRTRWIDGKREDGPTEDETKSLADSILARLPAELTEFLNKDWSGKELFAPEEYQALARFHGAMILAEHEPINWFDYVNDEECEELNEFIIKQNIPLRIVWSEDDEEFHEFFNKECMPLRNGWSMDEIEIIQCWLNSELRKHIKTCHYGILKAGCVTVCNQCRYSVTENWKVYERLKMFMRQKEKF